ncbi:VWA domain-containing protein [uncultured Nitrosomonas sp.]|uniref:nitric oxide reductase activation protein NorD n=1 Tax=uncultured Nitrosomonas sp. TaxID=156424 RepID=UPI002611AC8A|nr:VWA domain-containing protein [uncultured Nitrosomonas sp.]
MWQWLELEEQIGRLWHRLAGQAESSYPEYPSAAVSLESIHTALCAFFHGMGGHHGLPLVAGMSQASHHRRNLKQRLGGDTEKLPLAMLDQERLMLPATLCFFPETSLNRQCYFWLAAFFALARESMPTSFPDDPLQADLVFLHHADRISNHICKHYPGLENTYRTLCSHTLPSRLHHPLPAQEQVIEAIIRTLLGQQPCTDPSGISLLARIRQPGADFSDLRADKGYRPFLPVLLWGRVQSGSLQQNTDRTMHADSSTTRTNPPRDQEDKRSRKARRGRFDQSERDDPLLLNRFEKLITWSEMVNVNRAVEDDNEADAREAAESMEELAMTSHPRSASTVLKFDLDLSPEDTDLSSLLAQLTYPEWDYRRRRYHAAHCRIWCQVAGETGEQWEPGDSARRQFRKIRRQFEALRPDKEILPRQLDGTELDLDALVRARSDQIASGQDSDRLYLATRQQLRNLAVMILVDVSLSTDSWIHNRRILDMEKETLIALATGMAACRDTFSIYAFTSRKRHFVRLTAIKDFDFPFSSRTLRRISALRPGYYTRIGAALRHASQLLAQRPERHRLLLLLSDGKPNDLDHYEGRYGIEDTRQAIMEARRLGLNLFGITIDREAKDYFPYLFGRGGYAIINRPEKLIEIVPALYRQLTG